MEKNPKYKEDSVKFMACVFADGDAEEAHDTTKEGNTTFHTMGCITLGSLGKPELFSTALHDLKAPL